MAEIVRAMNHPVASDPTGKGRFRVETSRTYKLDEAAKALRDILKHHVGKLAFKIA